MSEYSQAVNWFDAKEAAQKAYKSFREEGCSPKYAHEKASDAAEKILGRIEGAWDIASLVQDAYGD